MERQAETQLQKCISMSDATKMLSQMCCDVLQEKSPVVIAIDGMSAALKSTFAHEFSKYFTEYIVESWPAKSLKLLNLSEPSNTVAVIHCDDFFLPKELRTQERLNEPGGNIDYCRMKAEVIDRFLECSIVGSLEDFLYHRFDCGIMELGEAVEVKKSKVYMVEGAYAMHPHFGKYYDLSVFMKVERDEQLARIRRRNGNTEAFESKWIPMELKYIRHFDVEAKADMIIDTTCW